MHLRSWFTPNGSYLDSADWISWWKVGLEPLDGWQVGHSILEKQILSIDWTDHGSMLHSTLGPHPRVPHGRALGGVGQRHLALGDGPLWALPLMATWMASRRPSFALFLLFCPCKHSSPSTCGTKWNLNITYCFLLDFIHFMAICWWQKRVLRAINSDDCTYAIEFEDHSEAHSPWLPTTMLMPASQ
jgi:hypothetical protein